MNFEKIQTEDRRLSILQVLASEPDYSVNEYVLKSALASLGHGVSSDRIRSDVAWLAEQDLVRVETVGSTTQVITVRDRGVDIANGLVPQSQHPGIKHPRPGE